MKRIFLILLSALVLVGCSDKDIIKHRYNFKGESKLWEVYYQEESIETFQKIKGVLDYDSDTEATLTVVYKNSLSDLKDVKKVEITYEAGSCKSVMTEEYEEGGPGSKTFTLTSNNGLVADEDGVVKVTISLDGETETLELK